MRRRAVSLAVALAAALYAHAAAAGQGFITLAAGTTTVNSGLLDDILPKFTARTGIGVRVVASGTGALLRLGEQGDADAVLVHDPIAEERFVAAGFGVERRPVMHSDFVIVGPADDPAGVRGIDDAAAALRAIARAAAPFVSRGDDSGTHNAELRLWAAVGVDPSGESGRWYLETGSGMGSTLNTVTAMGAYALTERGTWLSFGNRGDLAILVAGDPRLDNPYSVIVVNPDRHPHLNVEGARAFADWLTSPEGQRAIAEFTVDGERPFKPEIPQPGP